MEKLAYHLVGAFTFLHVEPSAQNETRVRKEKRACNLPERQEGKTGSQTPEPG
jgi:hypothetical protein